MPTQQTSFQITALPKSHFAHLLSLSSDELAAFRAQRVLATKKPGFPCRVSLADAEIGEEVILVNYEHQTADSPYRASHAVYVRQNAVQALPEPGVVPELLRLRTLSVRGFDEHGMLVTADLSDGKEIETALDRFFDDSSISYVHLHFAGAGCYAARADRL